LIARICLTCALTLITWSSLTPSPPDASIVLWDKLNHFLAFFTLAFLTHMSVPTTINRKDNILNGHLAYIFLLVYGVGIEIFQWGLSLSVGKGVRFFELMDIFADGVGIFAFLLLLFIKRHLETLAAKLE
jgi:VanZ family protein